MKSEEKTKEGDFVEIEFTGYVNGKIFDSNIQEDLEKISENKEVRLQKTIVIIGEGMVVSGLDKALEDKEINKFYEIHIPYKEAFGERRKELVKTIPLHVFTKHNVNPYPGAVLYLDNMLVRIITVSGARVITDFNNPLASKNIDYKFKIKKILKNEKEKLESFFIFFFRFVPEFEIKEKSIIIKVKPEIEPLVKFLQDKFRNIFGKELDFTVQENKETEEKEEMH